MANRYYLFSLDQNPTTIKGDNRVSCLKGISDYSYQLPLVFIILLKSQPTLCKSIMYDCEGNTAIYSSYEEGVKNLKIFFDQLSAAYAPGYFKTLFSKPLTDKIQALIQEALMFLESPENIGKYFILECCDIFMMNDEPYEQQCEELKQEIESAVTDVPRYITTTTDIMKIYALGLGYWEQEWFSPICV